MWKMKDKKVENRKKDSALKVKKISIKDICVYMFKM